MNRSLHSSGRRTSGILDGAVVYHHKKGVRNVSSEFDGLIRERRLWQQTAENACFYVRVDSQKLLFQKKAKLS
jgi:hypothetical protein